MPDDATGTKDYCYDEGEHSIGKKVRVVVHGTFDIA
jgi:hypothetical protein